MFETRQCLERIRDHDKSCIMQHVCHSHVNSCTNNTFDSEFILTNDICFLLVHLDFTPFCFLDAQL